MLAKPASISTELYLIRLFWRGNCLICLIIVMTQEAQSLSREINLIVNVYKFDLCLHFTSAFTKAHKIPRFSFSIKERGVLGEYVEAAVTRNIQFYVSITIHHSRSTFRKEIKVICICGHQR